MTVPVQGSGDSDIRLGIWVGVAVTMVGLIVWSPLLAFGMPEGRIFLWCLAILLPAGAAYALRKGRVKWAMGVIAPGALVVLGPLTAFATLIVYTASDALFYWNCVADVACCAFVWRVARSKGAGVWIALPMLFAALHMIFSGAVLYKLYRLPEPGYCEGFAEHEAVFRASLNHGGGLGHASLFIDDGRHLAATFKVDRDVMLVGLGDGEGNSIAVFPSETLKDGGIAIPDPVKLGEGEMPQFMLYDSKGRLVFTLTSAIDGKHRIGIIERPLEAPFKVDHWIGLPTPFEPNALLEDRGHYIIFALHAEVLKVDMETLQVVDHWLHTKSDWAKGRVVLSMISGGAGRAYLASLGFVVLEHNVRTRKNRTLHIPWGGAGGIVKVLEGKGELVVTDVVFHNLIIIDQETLEIKRVKKLDFGPRAIAWDPTREIIYVGEYVDGRVHAYHYADFSSAGESLGVGENLRSFTYDSRTRNLFASSKCGLMGVDVSRAFGGGLP